MLKFWSSQIAATTVAIAACACTNTAEVSSPINAAAGASSTPSGTAGADSIPDTSDASPPDGSAGRASTKPDPGPPPEPTIGPVMPGVWRDITPAALRDTVASHNPCTDVQFDPSNRSTLYAMFGEIGVYKSTDAGANWAPIGNLPTPTSLGRLLIDPKDPSHIYATGSVGGSSLGFWVSHDGGNTFAMPPAFVAGAKTTWIFDVYNLVADPTDFNHIIMTFHNAWPNQGGNMAGVLESKDGGETYIPHNPGAGMSVAQGIAFLYHPESGTGNANTWLVGGGYSSGLYRTADAGTTWTQVDPLEQDHGGFDAHFSSQGFIYIGAKDGVYRSVDNGVTWQNQSKDAATKTWTYSVISDGKYLYSSPAFVGTAYNQPYFVSPEGGKEEGTQWSAMSAQVIPHGPFKMTYDSVNRLIYSANWAGGIWVLNPAQ